MWNISMISAAPACDHLHGAEPVAKSGEEPGKPSGKAPLSQSCRRKRTHKTCGFDNMN